MSDFTRHLWMGRCPGCNLPFGFDRPMFRFVPAAINWTDEDHPFVAAAMPLCESCTYRWSSVDNGDPFIARADGRAWSWWTMDDELVKVQFHAD
ncbi:MAG: hypothetical protein Q7R41_08205 [Phycisphaerales bacterium]|nr:hypothetical protein [Phycisphaerales bacterium]